MRRLSAEVLTTENAREFSSAAKGETLEDTIRTVECYSDIIVLRHFESGSARRAVEATDIATELDLHHHQEEIAPEDLSEFLQLIKYVSGSYDNGEGFEKLNKEISKYEESNNLGSYHRLFYLAMPLSAYPSVCRMIRTYCMNPSSHPGWTRVIVEKPFGKDLDYAKELSAQLGELFEEHQLYIIDHYYLGKELVQNLLVLRLANRLFLPLWNRDNIDNIQGGLWN